MASAFWTTARGTDATGLVWPKTEIRVAGTPGAETVVVNFPFQNTAAQPVRIVSVKPSCDCLSASVSRPRWEAGAAGEIRAVFTVDGRTGLQDKYITVITDDAPGRSVKLHLLIDLPEEVVIRPRSLFWAVGSAPEEKVIQIMQMGPADGSLGEVQCIDDRFTIRTEVAKQRGMWLLRVTPKDTKGPAQASLRVPMRIGDRPEVYVLMVGVR